MTNGGLERSFNSSRFTENMPLPNKLSTHLHLQNFAHRRSRTFQNNFTCLKKTNGTSSDATDVAPAAVFSRSNR